jgi:hypothetical protein
MKNWKIGAIAGGISGLIGAWLINEYDFSLLFVVIICGLIGFLVGAIPRILKKKKEKRK